VLFVDPAKTESPIPNECTPHSKGAHTGNPKRGLQRPGCTQKGHIESEASMYSKGAHNCLPLPSRPKPPPMCWATPRLIEVIHPTERAAIQGFWRPANNPLAS
jgi:hypothetical protein